jgi:hypothetical protein
VVITGTRLGKRVAVHWRGVIAQARPIHGRFEQKDPDHTHPSCAVHPVQVVSREQVEAGSTGMREGVQV